MNYELREAARDAAITKIKEDARKYNHRHIDAPLSVPSVLVDDFSARLGFDAGYEAGKPKWIPVSERLPTKDGLYLITDTDTLEIEIAWCENGRFGFFPNKGLRIRFEALDHASAWQPLPDPFVE